jgi:hypothetical protein
MSVSFFLPGPRAYGPICRVSGCLTALVLTLLMWGTPRTLAGAASGTELTINTPMAPPAWAVLERELLRANSIACREFFQ